MRYIVEVENDEAKEALSKMCKKIGSPKSLSNMVIVDYDGYWFDIQNINGVVSIEEDDFVEKHNYKTQRNPKSWALPYINGRDGIYRYNRTGKNVDIYIMDTGIRTNHEDFSGRVETLYTYDGREYDVSDTHGTNAASCAAGVYCGVAKEANIINLRYNLTISDGIKILDALLDHHLNKGTNPSILNMSFGSKSRLLARSLYQLYEKGVILVAAAGNCNLSSPDYPGANSFVISAMSNNKRNQPSTFTNYGPGNDLFAPGTQILAANVRRRNGYNSTSGTSFSAPYTAGAIANLVEGSVIQTSEGVDMVKEKLLNNCWENWLHLSGKYRNCPNLVLNPNFNNEWFNFKDEFTITGTGDIIGQKIKNVKKGDIVKFKINSNSKNCEVKGYNNGGYWDGDFYITHPIRFDSSYIFD